MNGRQADKVAFKKDINLLVAGAKKHMAAGMPGKTAATMTAAKVAAPPSQGLPSPLPSPASGRG